MEVEGVSGGVKRVRMGPTFTNDQEMTIIDFVKEHPELYTKKNACYVDKNQKDLWNRIGEEIGRIDPQVRR